MSTIYSALYANLAQFNAQQERERRRAFAKAQIARVVEMGFTQEQAEKICQVGRPTFVVSAASWARHLMAAGMLPDQLYVIMERAYTTGVSDRWDFVRKELQTKAVNFAFYSFRDGGFRLRAFLSSAILALVFLIENSQQKPASLPPS